MNPEISHRNRVRTAVMLVVLASAFAGRANVSLRDVSISDLLDSTTAVGKLFLAERRTILAARAASADRQVEQPQGDGHRAMRTVDLRWLLVD